MELNYIRHLIGKNAFQITRKVQGFGDIGSDL